MNATTVPPADAALLDRLQAVQVAHARLGWETVRAADGNPYGLEIAEFGPVLACRSTTLRDMAPVNRAFGVGGASPAQLEALLDFFREPRLGWQCEFTPADFNATVAARLAARGVVQTEFMGLLYGPAQVELEPLPRICTEELGVEDLDRFMSLWSEGMSHPADWRTDLVQVWRLWFQMPGYRLYMAHYDGLPAAIAGLWCRDGVGELHAASTLLEYRGRGCQFALLARRIADAAAAGCDLVATQAVFASAGQRNLERAGLRLACTKAIWRDGG